MEREEAARLAREFGPSVYRLAYARTGNRHDAEDVMQEAFLTLIRKGPAQFDSEEHAKARLLRVAAQGKGLGYERWAKLYNLKQMAAALQFLQENGLTDYPCEI